MMPDKKLVDTDDILRAAKINKFGGEGAAKLLMLLMGLNKINRIYALNAHKESKEFISSLLKDLEIKYDISDDELERIPKSGPFITISNHPFGGIDGILLLELMSAIRPDYKVLANFLLQKIEPIKNIILPVNPFEHNKVNKSSVSGIRVAFSHLNEGHSIGLFPSGEVSSYYPHSIGITDKNWRYPVLKFIKNANVPVVPVYFQGTNSRLFHILGLIHPMLRTARLPSELFNKKNKIIRIRIGNPIPVNEQDEFTDILRYGRFLRAKTYALGTPLKEVKKFYIAGHKRNKKEEELVAPVLPSVIKHEIEQNSNIALLFQNKNFFVYCAPAVKIPNIMTELGRLRELTFREIGEGTNRKIDIDEFDLYYHQLFVWDQETEKIVGAYRLGKGKEILSEYGINGFYTQTLFRMNRKFKPILNQSIELGRSFIIKEYQRKPLPLFLLWKGILYFIIKNPEYRYLIGPVSISNRFSNFSKNAIIEFIKKHYYNHELAKLIKPRNQFKIPVNYIDTDILLENTNNISKLDKLIEDVETNFRMPVLLKKYIQQNGKIIGFNIDPKFNECLDGLLILDLFDVPMETISSLSKEINDDSLLNRFNLHEFNKASLIEK